MKELTCYSGGMQAMSMAGQEFFQNANVTFLVDQDAFKTLSKFPEMSNFIKRSGDADFPRLGDLYISAFLPHLLLVLVLVVIVSRVLHFLLRFVKTPLIVCQAIAGILVFSFINIRKPEHPFMSNKDETLYVHPGKLRVENVLGYLGVLFNLFMVGVKMDPSTIWSTGKKKPIIIGLSSQLIPIAVTFIVSFLFPNQLRPLFKESPYTIFIVYMFCSSYFPSLTDVLTELGLLNSELGRMALSCSVVQAILGWIFQFCFTVIIQGEQNWLSGVGALVSFLIIIAFIILVIRPYALSIVRATPCDGPLSELHMFLIVFAVFVVAWASDLLGTVATDGAVIMGLALPKGPPLGTALIERVDLAATELLLPIIFMKEGYNFSWEGVMKNLVLWFWVEVVVLGAFITRVVVTLAASMYCGMPLRKGLLLGLIMNFRGLVELLTYMRFVSIQLLDKTTFAMVVMSTISITSVCAPVVWRYYKPLGASNQLGRRTVQRLWSNAELRVMTCFYDDKPVPALLNFLESCSPECTSMCVYALHLLKLQGRAASALISHRNKKGVINPVQMDHVHNYFLTFGQNKNGVVVLPFTSIAPLKTIHQDVCTLIDDRNIALVVVPFPKINSMANVEANTAMRGLVPVVLEQAPCSVGILVYHGMAMITTPEEWKYHVGVLFWGGPDDREAISIACRMAHHPKVRLDIMRFRMSNEMAESHEHVEDDAEIAHNNVVINKLEAEHNGNSCVVVSEISVRNLEEVILLIRNLGQKKYDLIMVGRKQNNSSRLEMELTEWAQSPELGVVGDMLATDISGKTNMLVVHQHRSSSS